MTQSYFDAIVLGRELAPLSCAALLANRGFRVLVVGQQQAPPSYSVGRSSLPTAPYTFHAARSPLAERIFGELGLAQSFRRLTAGGHSPHQVALPGHRFDFASDDEAFEHEMAREFPELKRVIVDFHRQVQRRFDASNRLFNDDRMWPPESFLEKRELSRIAASLPFVRGSEQYEVLDELPESHPFRIAALAPAYFEAGSNPRDLTALQISRLYAGCYQHSLALEGGLEALSQLLIERIRNHSGEVRMQERASEISVHRGRANGVRLFGSDEAVGSGFVIAGTDVSSTRRLLQDRRVFEQIFEKLGEPQASRYRYTLNLVIDPSAVPRGMGEEVFLVGELEQPLLGANCLRIQKRSIDDSRVSLCVQALLPVRPVETQDGYLDDVRERLLEALGGLIPFLDEHVQLLDSPHDGRPPEARDPGENLALDPHLPRGPGTMTLIHDYPVSRSFGLCAMPVRTPLKGLLLCSPQVAPGLGAEGQLLAARSAARAVSQNQRGNAWMRKRPWSKVDI
ncbi:MAG: hypothetical protein OEZ06_21165 [Myxococcales bacterium]|nr:hypothetical protein [Myxococcales bacterium]